MHRIQQEFSYLSNDDIMELSKYSEIIEFEKETVIIEYGKYDPYFYYVLDGVVRGCSYTDDGDEYNIFFIL